MKIAGYSIKKRIGVGGQATVYEAVQESLQRRVALKVLNPMLASDREFTLRFLNDGRILANLGHPNAITIHDLGVAERLHYLSMELVEGGSLKELIRAGLDPDAVLDCIALIADCLARAHAMNIVHRDIKPGNVLFRSDGTLVLTDFGIAKRLDDGGDLTLTGTTLGSPGYLSPEQAQNRPVDGRADIYSLGAMAYEMFTGERPYVGESDFVTITRHVNDPVPKLPDGLARFQPLIQRMMAKSPDDRFEDAGALLAYLRGLRPEVAAAATAAPPDPGAVCAQPERVEPVPADGDDTTRVNVSAARPRLRRTRWASAAALAASVAGAGWFLARDADTVASAAGEVPSTLPATAAAPGHAADAPAAAPPGPVNLDGTGIVSSAPANAVARAPDRQAVPQSAPPTAQGPPQAPSQAAARAVSPPASGLPVAAAVPPPAGASPAARAVPAPPAPLPAGDAVRVEGLLRSARLALEELRLTRPENHNALHYYQQVLAIAPGNAEAQGASASIADRYAGLARQALAQGNRERARALVARGMALDADNPRLAAAAAEAEHAGPGVRVAGRERAAPQEARGDTPKQLYRRIKNWFQ